MNGPVDPGPEPSVWCARHQDGPPDGYTCGGCIEARQWHDEWARLKRAFDAETTSLTARESARLRRLDIDACGLCDEHGYIGLALCRHRPEQDDINARGLAAARAELARHQPPTPEEGAP